MTSAREPTTAGPFGGDDVRHEAEHAAGGEVDKLDYLLDLLTGGEDVRAEENSNDDNGQHVGVHHGIEEVSREYADDNGHDRGGVPSRCTPARPTRRTMPGRRSPPMPKTAKKRRPLLTVSAGAIARHG